MRCNHIVACYCLPLQTGGNSLQKAAAFIQPHGKVEIENQIQESTRLIHIDSIALGTLEQRH